MLCSIITINYNNAIGLKKTMDSVITQTYQDFEYIIIDGGSTDHAVQLIKENESHVDYWISEKDNGIYHAMNKGIIQAKGEYCLFLNSSDYFYESTSLSRVVKDLNGADIVGANPVFIYGKRFVECIYPKKLSKNFLLRATLLHQATFIKKELFHSVGLYNEQNRIVSDWEFFLKAHVLHQCSFKKSNVALCVFDRNGMSSQKENEVIFKNELRQTIKRLLPNDLEKYDYLQRNKNNKTTIEKIKKTGTRGFQLFLRLFGIHKEYHSISI